MATQATGRLDSARRACGRSDRLDFRYRAPALRVTLQGVAYMTINWSYTGVALGDCRIMFRPRTAALLAFDAGDDRPILVRARVVRSDPRERLLALAFIGDRAQLHGFFDRCLQGRFRS